MTVFKTPADVSPTNKFIKLASDPFSSNISELCWGIGGGRGSEGGGEQNIFYLFQKKKFNFKRIVRRGVIEKQ